MVGNLVVFRLNSERCGEHFKIKRALSIPPAKQRWGRTIQVQCFPLQSVLLALDNPTVNYFSLDLEGSKFAILNSLDWDNVDISIISVEMQHAGEIFDGTKQEIRNFF